MINEKIGGGRFGAQAHLHLVRKQFVKNSKKIKKFQNKIFAVDNLMREARSKFKLFGHLSSSQQKRQIRPKQYMNSKHFYRSPICLFFAESSSDVKII
jgi:hypothetical protein